MCAIKEPIRKDFYTTIKKVLRLIKNENLPAKPKLIEWLENEKITNHDRYSSHLYSESEFSAVKVKAVVPEYEGETKFVDGRVLLRENFDKILAKYPEVLIFGEEFR